MRDQVVEFLEANKPGLIRNSQQGFRKGSSCLTNPLLFLDKVSHGIDEGHGVDIVFLVLAKAFDKVPRQRLFYKLHKHGIYRWKAVGCNRKLVECIEDRGFV